MLRDDDPREVGGIELRTRLGEGGSSTVYEGVLPDGRSVAVKVLHPEIAASPDVRERLRREADALRAVQSERTAGVVAVDADSDRPHLVMELVRGESLDVIVQRRTLSGPLLRSLAEGIVDALDAIHGAGVVHRDLKPQNIIYGEDGVKVVDFGTSVLGEIAGGTRTGSITGTPSWLSPEQALGGAVTGLTDVFNLGMVIAFAATGRHPFGEGRPDAMIFRIVHQDPDLSALPADIRELVAACLTKEPGSRPTLATVARALRAVGVSSGSSDAVNDPTADRTRMGVGDVLAEAARDDVRALAGTAAHQPGVVGSHNLGRRPKRLLLALGGVVLLSLLVVAGGLFVRGPAEGPVEFVVHHRTTGSNPWVSEPRVTVTVGRDTASFTPASPTGSLQRPATVPLSGVRWDADERLQVRYEPAFGDDESFVRTFVLRELGVNRLASGWRVVIALDVYDDRIDFAVRGPRVSGIMRSRVDYAEVRLVRGNEQRYLMEVRQAALQARSECIAETLPRWRRTLAPHLDAFTDYEAAETRTRAYDGSNQQYTTWRSRWNSLTSQMSRDRNRLYAVRSPADYQSPARLSRVELAHLRLDTAWQFLSLGTFSARSGTFGTTTLVSEWNEMKDARSDLRSAVEDVRNSLSVDANRICEARHPRP